MLLRLIPTAAHSLEDVERTVKSFISVREKLEAGAYKSEKVLDMK
jgi:glycine C-acetyltransferase